MAINAIEFAKATGIIHEEIQNRILGEGDKKFTNLLANQVIRSDRSMGSNVIRMAHDDVTEGSVTTSSTPGLSNNIPSYALEADEIYISAPNERAKILLKPKELEVLAKGLYQPIMERHLMNVERTKEKNYNRNLVTGTKGILLEVTGAAAAAADKIVVTGTGPTYTFEFGTPEDLR